MAGPVTLEIVTVDKPVLSVAELARVEGEGALYIRASGGSRPGARPWSRRSGPYAPGLPAPGRLS